MKRGKKIDIWIDRIGAIISSITSVLALAISLVTLNISSNTYSISKEQILMNTTENLVISVEHSYNDDIFMNLSLNEANSTLLYNIKLSICLVNTSNLPIYIINESVYRADYGNDTRVNATIQELDLPFLVKPQETKFLDCCLVIEIPNSIEQQILEKFPDPLSVNLDIISKYLFFEKGIDLIGNKVESGKKNDVTYFKQHLTLPFSLNLKTSKGNTFSTEFYEGGPLFRLDKELTEWLIQQYGNWSFEFSKESTTNDSTNFFTSILSFLDDNPSIMFAIILSSISFTLVRFGLLRFFRKRREKEYSQNSHEDSHT